MKYKIRGLSKKITSNRKLNRRFNLLKRIHFCDFHHKEIIKFSSLHRFPFDLHDYEVTSDNYIYRAVINESDGPFNSINRIRYNPNPNYINRANIKGQGIAYYADAPDISIIEGCRHSLKNSEKRTFELTVSKWKILKKMSVQLVCNSKEAQASGTDLKIFADATAKKRRNELERKFYRTWFLKSRFLADQYAKNKIKCEKDYYISAAHSNSIFKSTSPVIDGIIYPSVQYLFKGFNFALPPRNFDESFYELREVFHVKALFDKYNIDLYPSITNMNSTSSFNGDHIIWD